MTTQNGIKVIGVELCERFQNGVSEIKCYRDRKLISRAEYARLVLIAVRQDCFYTSRNGGVTNQFKTVYVPA